MVVTSPLPRRKTNCRTSSTAHKIKILAPGLLSDHIFYPLVRTSLKGYQVERFTWITARSPPSDGDIALPVATYYDDVTALLIYPMVQHSTGHKVWRDTLTESGFNTRAIL